MMAFLLKAVVLLKQEFLEVALKSGECADLILSGSSLQCIDATMLNAQVWRVLDFVLVADIEQTFDL